MSYAGNDVDVVRNTSKERVIETKSINNGNSTTYEENQSAATDWGGRKYDD